MNCFLDAKRGRVEGMVAGFEQYGKDLDAIPLQELGDIPSAERRLLVEEAKLGCMFGMLLCLDREQRLAFVLGDIFECPSSIVVDRGRNLRHHAGRIPQASRAPAQRCVRRVSDDAPEKHRTREVLYEERAADLYREHPMLDGADLAASLAQLLSQLRSRAVI